MSFELLCWMSKKSWVKEVVNAVKAESTLENEAAVIPKIKLMAASVPKWFSESIGNKASVLINLPFSTSNLIPNFSAYK